MKLNAKGMELYKIWEQNYLKENDNLGGDSASGNYVEGWCIIDNYDYIKTLTDECGLWIFGYDDGAIDHIEECIEMYGEDDVIFTDITGKDYTCAQMKAELLKYYEMTEEEKELEEIMNHYDEGCRKWSELLAKMK